MRVKRPNKFALLVLLIAILCIAWIVLRSSPVLTVGIFAGSNWGVPHAEPYAIIDRAREKFEAEHPGVRVVYVSGIQREDYAEWLAGQFLRGEEPDVFLLSAEDFALYAEKGALYDLTPLMEGDAAFSAELYEHTAFQNGQYNGRSYALPMENMITLMFVNKTLLAREHLAMPSLAWTWADFLTLSRQITKDTDGDGVPDQFGAYDYTWQQAATANGVRLFRADGQSSYFADPRMEEALRFVKELEETHAGYVVTARDFDMGRVAFRPFTFAEYRTYKPYPWRVKKYSSFEWDCIPLPAGPSGGNISTMDSLLVGMSVRSQRREEAWALMKILSTDPEIQAMVLEKSHALPARRDVLQARAAQEIFLWDSGESAMTVADVGDAMRAAVTPDRFERHEEAMLYADRTIRTLIEEPPPFHNALNRLQKEINAILQQ